MRKLLKSIMAFVVVSLLSLSMVSALDNVNLEWGTVKINGDEVASEVLAVEEGQTLSIRVGLVSHEGAKDIEVDAKISGYEYSDYENLQDSTHLFDLAPETTKYVNLEVSLPKKLDKETYWLRLRVLDQDSAALTKEIKLAVEPQRHGVDIADVVLSPGSSVKAGRSLLATVLLENFGDKDEKDVKVTVSIPELGVKASEFVDVVATENHNIDYEDVPEMFLPVPPTAEEGDYEVKVTVEYDDLRETVSQSYTVHVLADEKFQKSNKLVLAVGPEKQSVSAGKTATYAIALTNEGSSSKAYLLDAVAGDWATASLSESLVVLEPGKNKVVYADLAVAADAPAGEHLASVVIKSGNDVLDTVVLKADVTESAATGQSKIGLRNGLEIALIVLVVLLVIVGLIIGFSRLKKDDEDKEEEQTYY
ncbi:MAG: hypothetical protein AB1668_01730 [Nanoarchaeota archaeon]